MSHDDRESKNPNRIDGVKWFEAVQRCNCGAMPEVWRTYIEVPGAIKRYAVRCHSCNHQTTSRSRNRAIRRWNEAVSCGGVS